MTSRIPVTAAGIASVHHRPIAITATARTRCPATERPAGVGKAIRTTDNPAIKTVIPSARHSLLPAFGPPFCVPLFSSLRPDSMGSAVMMEEARRNRAIQKIDSVGMMPFPMTCGFITECRPCVEKKGVPCPGTKTSPPIPAFSPSRRLPRSRGSVLRRGRGHLRTARPVCYGFPL